MPANHNILFVTGNSGKVTSFKKYLPDGYEVTQCSIPLVEPQADTVAEVVVAKAHLAYEKLGQSLVVNDSGFCIDALKSFPGPYTKYALETIGVSGLVKVTLGKKNRVCRFVQALTYCDENGNLTTFTEDDETGTIAEQIDPYDNPDDWSAGLWKIYIPNGFNVTLNHIIGTPQEKQFRDRRRQAAVFGQLVRWLQETQQ